MNVYQVIFAIMVAIAIFLVMQVVPTTPTGPMSIIGIVTANATPQANATISIEFTNGTVIGTTISDGQGKFNYTFPAKFPNGTYVVNVTAGDSKDTVYVGVGSGPLNVGTLALERV